MGAGRSRGLAARSGEGGAWLHEIFDNSGRFSLRPERLMCLLRKMVVHVHWLVACLSSLEAVERRRWCPYTYASIWVIQEHSTKSQRFNQNSIKRRPTRICLPSWDITYSLHPHPKRNAGHACHKAPSGLRIGQWSVRNKPEGETRSSVFAISILYLTPTQANSSVVLAPARNEMSVEMPADRSHPQKSNNDANAS